MKRTILVSLLIGFLSMQSSGQTRVDLKLDLLKSNWKEKNHWQKLGYVAVGSLPVFAVDKSVNKFLVGHQKPSLEFTEKYLVEPWGSGKYTFPFFTASIVWGYATQNEQLVDMGTIGLSSAFVAGLLTQIPKQLAHRQRPYSTANNPWLWRGPWNNGYQKLSWNSVKNGFFHSDVQSFCSGHTSLAFASAAAVAHRYPDQLGVQIGAYGLASLVGMSRMYQSYHWTSDVVYGMLLGLASNWIVEKRWMEAQKIFHKRDYTWID
jgi:membrane-associated phospholipid phosphatase